MYFLPMALASAASLVPSRPLLIGRPEIITERIQEYGLRITAGKDIDILNPQDQSLTDPLAELFYQQRKRLGVSRQQAQTDVRARSTLLGSMVLQSGRADAMLCGMVGRYGDHLRYVREAIGCIKEGKLLANMQMLMLPDRQLFICDTHVNLDPSAEEVAEISLLAAAEVRRLGITPRIALLSHSSFGSVADASATKMSRARDLIRAADPTLEVEGEMHGDAALSREILEREFPESELTAEANVLVMPNVDAANISFNLLRVAAGNGIAVGGILLGTARPVHIMVPSSTVRRIVNMTAMAVVDGAARGRA